MTMQVRLGGAWQEITGGKVFSSGAWRTLVAIKVYSGAAWRDVANFATPVGAFSISLNTSTVNKITTASSATTSNVTATPSGGLSPYTYSWARISGVLVSANASTSATTSFSASGLAEDEDRDATFRVTCTDSLGSTDTADVAVHFHRNGSGGL